MGFRFRVSKIGGTFMGGPIMRIFPCTGGSKTGSDILEAWLKGLPEKESFIVEGPYELMVLGFRVQV